MKIYCKFLIFLLVMGNGQKVSAKTINLATFKIPQYIQNEDRGEFITLVKTIAQRLGLEINLTVLPAKRALKAFGSGAYDGYFPGTDGANSFPVYNSNPFYYKKSFLFYRKDTPISNLSGHKICLTRGYNYGLSETQKKNVNFYYSVSDETCLAMLLRKRVDGFLGEILTGLVALEKIDHRNISIHEKQTSSIPVYFTFQKNEKGKELAESFSRELLKMKKNKELKLLFQKTASRVSHHLKVIYDPSEK